MLSENMTLRELNEQSKKLRWTFPGKEIGIAIENRKPRIVVSDYV